MEESRIRFRGKRGCLCAAGAACAAVIGFSAPSAAQAPSQKPEIGARGAAGATVQYEEAPGANVLYLEEKGSMVSAIALPVPEGGKAPAPAPARKALAKRSPTKPAERATRVVPPARAGDRP